MSNDTMTSQVFGGDVTPNNLPATTTSSTTYSTVLPTEVIVGIVVGISGYIVLMAILCHVICLCARRRKQKASIRRKPPVFPENPYDNPPTLPLPHPHPNRSEPQRDTAVTESPGQFRRIGTGERQAAAPTFYFNPGTGTSVQSLMPAEQPIAMTQPEPPPVRQNSSAIIEVHQPIKRDHHAAGRRSSARERPKSAMGRVHDNAPRGHRASQRGGRDPRRSFNDAASRQSHRSGMERLPPTPSGVEPRTPRLTGTPSDGLHDDTFKY